MTTTNDPVFHAIRRDYRSRLTELIRDRDRKAELTAQLAGIEEMINTNMVAILALETFAHEHNWKDFD